MAAWAMAHETTLNAAVEEAVRTFLEREQEKADTEQAQNEGMA